MVYDDIPHQKNSIEPQAQTSKYYRASVLDRVFSFLLDYLVLSPVISFLILIFFQKEISIWSANTLTSELKAVFVLLAISYVVFFSFLQSLFIYFWQATPGQYFLKLKVVDQKADQGIYFFRILFRQLGFWSSFLLLGFPWISVLAHSEQKTFYDKLSETKVISLKAKPDFFTFEFETRYWQALMGTLMVFVSVILLALGWQQHQNIKASSYTFEKMRSDNFFCDDLKSVQFTERLQMVVALNLVGQIADDCVDKEADFVLWKSDNQELRSLAYYAKSLTEIEEKAENLYLESACQGYDRKVLGCKLATAFLDHELLDLYKSLKFPQASENFLTAVLRYEFGVELAQNDDQKANFKKLKNFDTHQLVKKYLLSEILDQYPKSTGSGRSIAAEDNQINILSDDQIAYSRKLIHDM